RVSPCTLIEQLPHVESPTRHPPLDLRIVLASPAPYSMAAVPRGLVPDQQEGGAAVRREACGAPRQASERDGTHGTPRDQPEPPRVQLVWPRPDQQSITGQRLGIGSIRRWGQ